ncbi:hypothetical protein [uncultured Rhodoblastus sp.]|uniref:hypothetical protein n=1 Tax=uncultured Rhodoblastus sp. TaxID=543037 RepID=UPI0025D4CA1D|nr:hypothetical protein [uncultured Rhodoblastus sp.]
MRRLDVEITRQRLLQRQRNACQKTRDCIHGQSSKTSRNSLRRRPRDSAKRHQPHAMKPPRPFRIGVRVHSQERLRQGFRRGRSKSRLDFIDPTSQRCDCGQSLASFDRDKFVADRRTPYSRQMLHAVFHKPAMTLVNDRDQRRLRQLREPDQHRLSIDVRAIEMPHQMTKGTGAIFIQKRKKLPWFCRGSAKPTGAFAGAAIFPNAGRLRRPTNGKNERRHFGHGLTGSSRRPRCC